ncbi:MAG: hypothetical protein U9P00_10565 [Pseudomonadota bacterium]|nr:hypothetical protein [Pseudomonadota bacterium]
MHTDDRVDLAGQRWQFHLTMGELRRPLEGQDTHQKITYKRMFLQVL